MGSKVKEMPLKLFQKVGYSSKSSYTFAKKHPFLSSATLIFFILYMCLSYIYNFLAYLSPFIACAIIFLQIFWSSEQTEFKYVKKDEEKAQSKKIESKPKIPLGNRPRRELLYKYPSQNATSRRRNFRGKRLDVYGGLEEKAKDLNAAFYNEFTAKNKPPRKQALRSEPSMRDLVENGGSEIETERIEEDEEDAETQEENKKAIEWTEDDQRNFMDLGKSDLERNKRLENLIAKRKHRKNFRFHPDTKKNGLDDKKSAMPRHLISPVLVSRDNCFDQNVPGSAPSVMPRSPYDIPYDPFEEKMDLSGGSFSQDFVIGPEDMPSSRHGSFNSPQLPQEELEAIEAKDVYGSGSNSQPKFRQLPDKGSHDWLVDQLMCTAAEAAKNGGIIDQAPNPLKTGEDETTQEADPKIQSNNNITAMKDEKAEATKSIASSDQTRKPFPKYSGNKPPGRLLYFSLPNNTAATATATATATAENEYENFPSPLSKRHEAIFFGDRRNILNNCHTPTYSIASDLQVEVSEVGSLASTVDENGESGGDESSSPESSGDRDSSVLYDGDIDRDVSSGSEELWGASFHGNKQSQQGGGVNEEEDDDNGEANNKNRKEDTMMVASTSTTVGGSEAPRRASSSSSSSSSSSGSSPPKQLISSSSVEDLSNIGTQAHVSPQEEWSNNNLGENNNLINGVINNLNNLIRANEQYNRENSSQSNEDHSMLSVARQESIDENLIFSIASSPRSVLPEKAMSDDVSSPSAFDQHDEVHANSVHQNQLSTMEGLGQETSNVDELPFNTTTIPQANLPLREDSTHEAHDFQLQCVFVTLHDDQNNLSKNSMEEYNISTEINNEAKAHNQEVEDKSKNNNKKNNDDNNNPSK